MVENGWRWLKMVEDGWRWLEMVQLEVQNVQKCEKCESSNYTKCENLETSVKWICENYIFPGCKMQTCVETFFFWKPKKKIKWKNFTHGSCSFILFDFFNKKQIPVCVQCWIFTNNILNLFGYGTNLSPQRFKWMYSWIII